MKNFNIRALEKFRKDKFYKEVQDHHIRIILILQKLDIIEETLLELKNKKGIVQWASISIIEIWVIKTLKKLMGIQSVYLIKGEECLLKNSQCYAANSQLFKKEWLIRNQILFQPL